MAQPTPENLQRLAELLDDGTLRVPIQHSYELAHASEALAAFGSTHTQGNLSITISEGGDSSLERTDEFFERAQSEDVRIRNKATRPAFVRMRSRAGFLLTSAARTRPER